MTFAVLRQVSGPARVKVLLALLCGVTAWVLCACSGDGSSVSRPVQEPEPLAPSADATLYESSSGLLANGAGVSLYVGTTRQESERVRRALIRFDLSELSASCELIRSAQLRMTVTRSQGGALQLSVYRVLTEWNEGSAGAGTADDGRGAPAGSGDATWLHTGSGSLWTMAGGDHDQSPALQESISATTGVVTIQDATAGLRDLVQFWRDNPGQNFGALLVSDESLIGTVRRFQSRESGSSGAPQLVLQCS